MPGYSILSDSLQIDHSPINQQMKPKNENPILDFAQRYQAFFDSTNDAIAIFSLNGDVLDAYVLALCHCTNILSLSNQYHQ